MIGNKDMIVMVLALPMLLCCLDPTTTTGNAFSLKAQQQKKFKVRGSSLSSLFSSSSNGGVFVENEDFAFSSSTTSNISQDMNNVPLSSPPMARPNENTKLAVVDKMKVQETPPPTTAITDDNEVKEEPEQESVWLRQKPIDVQGGSLRTWSFAHQYKIDMIQVHMKTDGRPLNANVELWQGPDNVPQKVAVYIEDGRERPFRCFFATPHGQNSISIRNTNTLEYPLHAVLEGVKVGTEDPETKEKMKRIQTGKSRICQGGAVITERFEPDVQSVQIFLQSEGRPLQCRIELIQGPNNVKQVMEVYTEEGSIRPFYAIVETPGSSNCVIRIVNSSTMEFPFTATVEPWDIEQFDPNSNSPFEISGGHNGDWIGSGNTNNNNVGGGGSMGGMFGSSSPSSTTTSTSVTVSAQSKRDSNFFLDKELR